MRTRFILFRDLWRQKDIPMGLYHIAPHGVLYLKVTVK